MKKATRELASLFIATALVIACGSSGSSPTEPDGTDSTLALSEATVAVEGEVVNGQTYHHGDHSASSTRFEARLHRDGAPVQGGTVTVGVDRGGMMGPGQFHLYDDGTHGDPVAGDGWFCFEDHDGTYGIHRHDGHHGEYHYEFWGEHQGESTPHHDVTVWVEG